MTMGRMYHIFSDLTHPQEFKYKERWCGLLPFQLTDEQRESAIKLTDGYIYINEIESHVGIYNQKGQFEYNELGALEEAIKDNDLDFIEYLDEIVPLENERYTTYSFSAKKALESGLNFERKTYLMQDDSGFTKIGMAKSPLDRQTQLSKDFPSIKLVAICPYYCERELHLLFRHKRVIRKGVSTRHSVEWYNLTDEDITYICRNYNFTKYDRQCS